MAQRKQAVLVTGISGSLGLRLLPQLQPYDIVGIDVAPLRTSLPVRFASIDLGRESSCRQLVELLKETNASAVVHLAFIVDPASARLFDPQRQWQVNVAGTARVMEAITEVNRLGGAISKFIFTSSTQVYGPELDSPATEATPLDAHTLPYAIHKRAADETVQYRASSLGHCNTFILRAPTYAGTEVTNHVISALRGLPTAHSKRAIHWRKAKKRVPFFVPFGERYQQNLWQFMHVDDMARLISYVLERPSLDEKTSILNVSGRDGSLSLQRSINLAGGKTIKLPGRLACHAALGLLSNLGVSSIPYEALPYLLGSYPVDTTRLKQFLGSAYREVIRHTAESALCDSLVAGSVNESVLENSMA